MATPTVPRRFADLHVHQQMVHNQHVPPNPASPVQRHLRILEEAVANPEQIFAAHLSVLEGQNGEASSRGREEFLIHRRGDYRAEALVIDTRLGAFLDSLTEEAIERAVAVVREAGQRIQEGRTEGGTVNARLARVWDAQISRGVLSPPADVEGITSRCASASDVVQLLVPAVKAHIEHYPTPLTPRPGYRNEDAMQNIGYVEKAFLAALVNIANQSA